MAATEPTQLNTAYLPLTALVPSPFQPRVYYDPKALEELSADLALNGVRDRFIAYLREIRGTEIPGKDIGYWPDWVEVQYGDDCNETRVVRSSDDDDKEATPDEA